MGELRLGETACERCDSLGLECWVYSSDGEYRVANAGQVCARCRTSSRKARCSLVTKQPRPPRGPLSPPSGPINSLSGPPAPGGGSAGAAVPVS
jgi:hypothetical protein